MFSAGTSNWNPRSEAIGYDCTQVSLSVQLCDQHDLILTFHGQVLHNLLKKSCQSKQTANIWMDLVRDRYIILPHSVDFSVDGNLPQ